MEQQQKQEKTNVQQLLTQLTKNVRAFDKLRLAAIQAGGVYSDEKVDSDKTAITTLYGVVQEFAMTVDKYETLIERQKESEKELIDLKSKVATLEKEKNTWKEKADKLQQELTGKTTTRKKPAVVN